MLAHFPNKFVFIHLSSNSFIISAARSRPNISPISIAFMSVLSKRNIGRRFVLIVCMVSDNFINLMVMRIVPAYGSNYLKWNLVLCC